VFSPQTGGKSDLGRDFYAPQILQVQDGSAAGPKAMLWGWANEGPGRDGRRGRSQEEIDAAGWAGVLTHPRLLSVVDGALAVAPAPEVDAYRGARVATRAGGNVLLPSYAEAVVTAHSGGPAALAGDAVVELSLMAGDGPDASRQVVFSGPLAAGEELRAFVDASLVEVYRSGAVATTLRAYPAPGEQWVLQVPAGAVADVWQLEQPA
jgi:beta-fructofuranosidase